MRSLSPLEYHGITRILFPQNTYQGTEYRNTHSLNYAASDLSSFLHETSYVYKPVERAIQVTRQFFANTSFDQKSQQLLFIYYLIIFLSSGRLVKVRRIQQTPTFKKTVSCVNLTLTAPVAYKFHVKTPSALPGIIQHYKRVCDTSVFFVRVM